MRHGYTALNSAERYWGRTDVELSTDGLRQAERLRDRLATEKIDAIYSSNLKRALVTAETITSRHRLEVITCAEMDEMNFGELEGMTFDDIHRLHPEVVKLWRRGDPKLKFPGGESLEEFNRRVTQFAARLKEHAPQETILIVAHSGSLRSLMCHLMDIELKRRWQFRLGFASLTILETYPQGAILHLLNEVSHLAGL